MRSTLRMVCMPNRLDSVPKPVALRYLDKDAQGHTRIRTSLQAHPSDIAPVVPHLPAAPHKPDSPASR